jgi:hypothetical protein
MLPLKCDHQVTVSSRAQFFEASLRRKLAEETQRASLDPLGRLSWLREQLENYFDRWAAFAALGSPAAFESTISRSAFKGDLFTMVEVACQVYEDELFAVGLGVSPSASLRPNPQRESWNRFSEAFRHLCDTSDGVLVPGVRKRLVALAIE